MPATITNQTGGVIRLEGNSSAEVNRLRKMFFGDGSFRFENFGEFVMRIHERDKDSDGTDSKTNRSTRPRRKPSP